MSSHSKPVQPPNVMQDLGKTVFVCQSEWVLMKCAFTAMKEATERGREGRDGSVKVKGALGTGEGDTLIKGLFPAGVF